MLLKRSAEKLLANDMFRHVFCLLFSLGAIEGIPFVGVVSCLIVALTSLVKGSRAGLYCLLWAGLPVIAWLIAEPLDLTLFLAVKLVLVWGLCSYWSRPGVTVGSLIWVCLGIGLLAITVFQIVVAHQPAVFWSHWLHLMQEQLLQWVHMPAASVNLLEKQVLSLAPYMTGLLVAGVLLDLLIVLICAHLWRSAFEMPKRTHENLSRIHLNSMSFWLALLLAIAALVLWYVNHHFQGGVSQLFWLSYKDWLYDAIPVFAVMYACAGLSLLHALLSYKKSMRWSVYLVYALLFILPQFMVVVLACLAMVDSLLNLRGHLKGAASL